MSFAIAIDLPVIPKSLFMRQSLLSLLRSPKGPSTNLISETTLTSLYPRSVKIIHPIPSNSIQHQPQTKKTIRIPVHLPCPSLTSITFSPHSPGRENNWTTCSFSSSTTNQKPNPPNHHTHRPSPPKKLIRQVIKVHHQPKDNYPNRLHQRPDPSKSSYSIVSPKNNHPLFITSTRYHRQ